MDLLGASYIIILGVLSSIIATPIATILTIHLIYRRERKPIGLYLEREWLSRWRPKEQGTSDIVQEKIRITPYYREISIGALGASRRVKVASRSIHFYSIGNTSGYEWEGEGRILFNRYFQGAWQSKSGPDVGTFTLEIHPDRTLTGTVTGTVKGGGSDSSNWALGASEEDLKRACEMYPDLLETK